MGMTELGLLTLSTQGSDSFWSTPPISYSITTTVSCHYFTKSYLFDMPGYNIWFIAFLRKWKICNFIAHFMSYIAKEKFHRTCLHVIFDLLLFLKNGKSACIILYISKVCFLWKKCKWKKGSLFKQIYFVLVYFFILKKRKSEFKIEMCITQGT